MIDVKLMPTAAYIRVSTQEQKMHGISLDAQRDKLAEYAKVHHLKIVAWYKDEGISGRKLIRNRPALQQMISDSKSGKFQHIIFIKLDRFFRSVAEYHECMKQLGSITWTATEEKYDLSTANGRAFVNMKLTIAELEADQTGERIRLVNDYKVRTGQPLHGSQPWGYKIVQTEHGKRIVIDDLARDQALDVINYYLTTGTLRQTLIYAKQYHSFYDLRGLRNWLSNKMLYGAYRGNSEYCEALIDQNTYDKIQSMLGATTIRLKTHTYLFSGQIKCPECGKSMCGYVCKQTVHGKDYYYKKYRCDSKAFHRGCNYGFVWSENKIEECLLNQIEGYIDNELNLEIKKRKRYPLHCGGNVDKLKSELERLNYMFQKGRLSISDYDSQYQILQSKIKAVNNQSAETTADKLLNVKTLIKDGWREVYNDLDREHKRAFWHSFAREFHIERDRSTYLLVGITLL